MTCWPPSPCARLSRARTTTGPPPHHAAISWQRAFPPVPGLEARTAGRTRVVPTFTSFRSARSALSYTPAASPCLRRRHSAWPPRRQWHTASELTQDTAPPGHALHTGPDPPGSSRHLDYRASATDSLSLRPLTLLAGPRPSGSTGPSRHCRGCSHPPRRFPDQAAPSFAALLRQVSGGWSLTSTRISSASRRTKITLKGGA